MGQVVAIINLKIIIIMDNKSGHSFH